MLPARLIARLVVWIAVAVGVLLLVVPGDHLALTAATTAPHSARHPARHPAQRAARPSSPPAAHYTPTTRAMFNDPLGSEDAHTRLFRRLATTIDATPRSGVIRIAVFSFSYKPVADALLRAAHRGVAVKLIFAGHHVYPSMQRVQDALGRNPAHKDFAIFCHDSCRGTAGQMHAKFFSFSRVGRARDVVMIGSDNVTQHNADDQWSDVTTLVGRAGIFNAMVHWFSVAKLDKPVADPYVDRYFGNLHLMITPVSLARHPDPLVQELDAVTCVTPGQPKPTALLLAQHAWNGDRGVSLARQVAGLAREGCNVRLLYGEGVGPAVRHILETAGVHVKTSRHKPLTHEKLLVVNGHVGRSVDAVRVVTGSQNWTTRALPRDDLILEINDQTIGHQYVVAYWHMWDTA